MPIFSCPPSPPRPYVYHPFCLSGLIVFAPASSRPFRSLEPTLSYLNQKTHKMQLLKPLIALTLAASALASVHGPSKVHPSPPKPTPTCAKGTTALCCNKMGYANDGFIGLLMGLLNIHVAKPRQTLVGVTCNALGNGRNSW